MLDRLVGGAILADTDAVMGEHVDDPLAHQRGKPDRGAAIVGEHEERAAIRDERPVQRDAVHAGGHSVFPHAVVEVVGGKVGGRDRRMMLGLGAVGTGQIGRAADELGNERDQLLERQLRPDAGRAFGGIGEEGGLGGSDSLGDGGGIGSSKSCLGGRAGGELAVPLSVQLSAASRGRAPCRENGAGNFKRRGRPAKLLAGALDLGRTQCAAVCCCGSCLGGCAIADDGLAGDEPGLGGIGACGCERLCDAGGIVAIDAHRIPAARLEAADLVVGNGKTRRAVDGDGVVVEQHDELAKFQMARERDRLVRDTLHQAAVTGDAEGVMVDEVGTGTRRKQALGDRHAGRIRNALAERARRRLDACCVAELGVAGGFGAELAEALDLLDGHIAIAGEVQERV